MYGAEKMKKKMETGSAEREYQELLTVIDYGIPGIPQLFGFIPASRLKRLLWATIFISALVFTAYEVTTFFARYASKPSTKKFDWTYRDMASFPSIAVCHENGFKPKVAKEYLKSGVPMPPYPIKDWDFKKLKDGQGILNAINRSFFHLDDIIQECYLSGHPCTTVGWWSEKRTESQGLCHVFVPDPTKPMPTGGGRLKGYILNFTKGDWFCDAKDPICGNVQDSGWLIFLNEGAHTDRDAVLNEKVIRLAPGETRRYRVSTDDVTLLDKPEAPCYAELNFSSTMTCLEDCLYLHILKEANVTCWPYWMPTMAGIYPRPCGTEEEYKRIWLVSGKLLESDIDDQQFTVEEGNGTEWGMLWPEKILQEDCTHCARACRTKQFDPVARNGATIKSGDAFINIILDPDFQYHSEIWAYEFPQLVSDFGGVLGLMLNASILTLILFLDHLFTRTSRVAFALICSWVWSRSNTVSEIHLTQEPHFKG